MMKPMKSLMTPFVVLAFLGISVFGFTALHNGMHGGNCLASTLGGGVCAPNSDGFGFASFHLNAFKIFSNATFELALVVLVLFFAAGVVLFLGGGAGPNLKAAEKTKIDAVPIVSQDFQFKDWLTLLEKRDPALSF